MNKFLVIIFWWREMKYEIAIHSVDWTSFPKYSQHILNIIHWKGHYSEIYEKNLHSLIKQSKHRHQTTDCSGRKLNSAEAHPEEWQRCNLTHSKRSPSAEVFARKCVSSHSLKIIQYWERVSSSSFSTSSWSLMLVTHVLFKTCNASIAKPWHKFSG